jgi:hypothetical protein
MVVYHPIRKCYVAIDEVTGLILEEKKDESQERKRRRASEVQDAESKDKA